MQAGVVECCLEAVRMTCAKRIKQIGLSPALLDYKE